MSILSEHCSCDVLSIVNEDPANEKFGRLTQMEVIFEAVAQCHQAEDEMPDCWKMVSLHVTRIDVYCIEVSKVMQQMWLLVHKQLVELRMWNREDFYVRAADGFCPKYLA